jgi:hypothetical protein
MKIKEPDSVVLTTDLPKEKLESGDGGTVVHIHKDGEAYEVEFVTLMGRTVTVATVMASDVRSISKNDLWHVRTLEPSGVREDPANYGK